MDTVKLTIGKGRNKRIWELSDDDFTEFESYYEECELLSVIADENVLTLETENKSDIRQWDLSESEFAEFEMRFEEQELI